MTIEFLHWTALCLAGVTAALFVMNLALYRRLPNTGVKRSSVFTGLSPLSVLVPARNEADKIEATITSILRNKGAEFELLVLNDHSTDGTEKILARLAATDPRLKVAHAPPLPPGWCGKQHACHVLSKLARHPVLVFMDADVQLQPDSLRRISHFMQRSGADLASGVPRQLLSTFSDRLLLPLIHFLLLGYLPMFWARRSRHPAFAAGCGQLIIARADSYAAVGGHGVIRTSLHDGIQLPRAFRRHGFKTELFDATDIAQCRMYTTDRETWQGLAKNATEGIGAPASIVPMSALLLVGQVIPWMLLAAALLRGTPVLLPLAACFLGVLPRLIGLIRFHQPLIGVLSHPLGILALTGIQWVALLRKLRGQPSSWKGRTYGPPPLQSSPPLQSNPLNIALKTRSRSAVVPLLLVLLVLLPHLACLGQQNSGTNTSSSIKAFTLQDQFGAAHHFIPSEKNLRFLTIADKAGSEQVRSWVQPLKNKYGDRLPIDGIADMSSVPALLRSLVKNRFKDQNNYPVMLDWSGNVVQAFRPVKKQANVYLVASDGKILLHLRGQAEPAGLAELFRVVELHLAK